MDCIICGQPATYGRVCFRHACRVTVVCSGWKNAAQVLRWQRDEAEALLTDAHRVQDKALVERDVARIQYHDGMKALLWLVQLHAKMEAEDEIEHALEVAEEQLGIWVRAREAT